MSCGAVPRAYAVSRSKGLLLSLALVQRRVRNMHHHSRRRIPVTWLRRSTCVLVLLACARRASAQKPVADSAQAAQRFVETFYRWYAPKAVAATREPAAAVALRERRSVLDQALARALAADLSAQAKVRDEIVGLDADPFLNSQDPCEASAVGSAMRKYGGFRVPVFAICGGKRTPTPVAFADVRAARGRWTIVDVLGADGTTSLAATLRQLASERREHAKGAATSATKRPHDAPASPDAIRPNGVGTVENGKVDAISGDTYVDRSTTRRHGAPRGCSARATGRRSDIPRRGPDDAPVAERAPSDLARSHGNCLDATL